MDAKTEQTLENILEYCCKIQEASARFTPTKACFDEEAFYRDGLAFYIQQIGELVKELPDDFTNSNREIAWHQISGFRNVIAHAYFSVDSRILWDTLQEDIPQLKAYLERLLGLEGEVGN